MTDVQAALAAPNPKCPKCQSTLKGRWRNSARDKANGNRSFDGYCPGCDIPTQMLYVKMKPKEAEAPPAPPPPSRKWWEFWK